MDNSFNIYSFLALFGCLLTGLAFAWLLYGWKTTVTIPIRIALAAVRTITVTLILWLLFSPLIKQVSYTLEKPIIIIAQDNSQSAGAVLPVGFDSLKYRKDLQQLSKGLSEKYDVRLYSFSDAVINGLDFSYRGKFTDATAFTTRLTDEFMNRNVGAVIMATDGIFNKGGNPVTNLEAMKAPVYTILLGDTIPKKDLVIANVTANDLVYLDNDFKIEVQLQAYQCDGQTSKLMVLEDGKKVHEEFIRIKEGLFSKNISVQLKASKIGRHQYTVSLSAVSNEVSLKNNRQQIAIEVIDDRQKILIAASGPHPDIAAIRQAITLNKHYEVSVIMNKELLNIDPKAYGLIILYQLPSLQFEEHTFIRKVNDAKIPVWYIIGAQTNINKFNQSQKQVNILQANGDLQYIYSDINRGLSTFDLDSGARKVIESFDPLQAPFGTLNISGNSQAVFNQRIGKIKTSHPQLFFMNDNGRKTGFLIGEGLWKWKLSETSIQTEAPVFNQLISNIIQYLAVKDDKRKFKVYPVKNVFDENEQIVFNAILYNDSYQLVNTPDVNIQIKDERGKTYNFTFSKFESLYQLDAGILPSGKYTFVANTTLGNQKYLEKGSFLVQEEITEFQQTIANHQLLYRLSAQTNGKTYAPNQLLELKEELFKSEQMKTLSYEDRKYEELINLKWLFMLILLLLSTEWFFRKRNAVP